MEDRELPDTAVLDMQNFIQTLQGQNGTVVVTNLLLAEEGVQAPWFVIPRQNGVAAAAA